MNTVLNLIRPYTCLFFGQDSEFFQRLSEHFGENLRIIKASSNFRDVVAFQQVDLALCLWNRNVTSTAREFHKAFPAIPLIIERNRTSFQGRIPRNGYASLIDRTQDRWELIEEIHGAISKLVDKPVESTPREKTLNLSAALERLPQVFAGPQNSTSFYERMLECLLVCMRSRRGGLYRRSKTEAVYCLKAETNLISCVGHDSVACASEGGRALARLNDSIYVSGNGEPALDSLLHILGCDLIMPLADAAGLLGFVTTKSQGAIAKRDLSNINSLTILFAELIARNDAIEADLVISVTRHAIERETADAVMHVSTDGSIMVIHDQKGLIHHRLPKCENSYTQLLSPTLKNIIYIALNGNLVDSWLVDSLLQKRFLVKVRAFDGGLVLSLHAWSGLDAPSASGRFSPEAYKRPLEAGSRLAERKNLSMEMLKETMAALQRPINLSFLNFLDESIVLSASSVELAISLLDRIPTEPGVKTEPIKVVVAQQKASICFDVHLPSGISGYSIAASFDFGLADRYVQKAAFGFRLTYETGKSPQLKELQKPQLCEASVIQHKNLVLHQDSVRLKSKENGPAKNLPTSSSHHRGAKTNTHNLSGAPQ